ncbi:acyl-CoA carboxylase subunit epsilon [Amycolatopsis sp.]|uniref:acyl-CoA carboxylase subunit epsilon n=1 Tax=Amycolatopsis sp. TaxID=37632 RepID=UPI002D8022E0|nr:acyl-CoA carboxylase subunit epsilon [Amycolatopsis sp.]HET6703614.1 acyl-CoA carboxylase subunit epsilon [Amycolatopsis sp.]
MSEIRVVRGTPDDGELAALVTVLSAAAATRPPEAPRPSVWGDPAWRGREVRAAVGAWRMSGLPH